MKQIPGTTDLSVGFLSRVPRRCLDHPRGPRSAIAVINSLGNLAGFVAPFGFGLVKDGTGNVPVASEQLRPVTAR